MFHKTHEVHIGNPANGAVLKIGGGLNGKPKNAIAVQSMTNTDTADVIATVAQIMTLCDAGAEMMRITVNNFDAAKAVPRIKDRLLKKGYNQPIIGDFHYNGHILLAKYPDCAKALDKYRINPGNVGAGAEEGENFAAMVKMAVALKKPVRIGVNWGSLDPEIFSKLMDKNARLCHPRPPEEITREAVVQSALNSAIAAEKLGLPADKIVLSVKMSAVQDVIAAYEKLASLCDYALHLGLTEAGSGDKGLVASTAALAILLQKGIGDTIRFSLTPAPAHLPPRGLSPAPAQQRLSAKSAGPIAIFAAQSTRNCAIPQQALSDPRTREVSACQLLLQTMGIRNYRPLVTSCPGCGRTANDLHQKIADIVNGYINKKLPLFRKKHPGIERLKIAVMGCVVNGPGEASHADIGISLPGKSEKPLAPVYIEGKRVAVLKGFDIPGQFLKILDDYIAKKFNDKI